MGIKGSKNTPITARVSTGLFNQKKGVKEPLLNVGPAGVHGNNQTKDIPSPSKMRGYSMKASPFKQNNDDKPVESTKVGVNVLKTETAPDTEKEVNVPGEEKTRIKTAADVGVSQEEVNAYNMKTYGTLNPTKEGKANNTIGTGVFKPDTKKKEIVKGETTTSNQFTANKTRDKGDAQTSLDRRNTVRAGKHTARTKKAAQRKVDRNLRRSGAIDPSTIKKDKDGNAIEGSGKKYNKRDQRLKRQGQQAKDNLAVSTGENESVKRQSKQNISTKSGKDVLDAERDMKLSDVGGKTAQDKAIKEGSVNSSKAINFAEIAKTKATDTEKLSGVLPKKTPDFFKKKSPLKMKYFK